MSTVKKKKIRGLWSEENMKKAIAVLLTGQVSLKETANTFQIPMATLRRRFGDIKAGKEVSFAPAMGRFKPTFSKELEEQLVLYVKALDSIARPFKRDDFLKLSYDLACHLKLPHQFNSQLKSAGRKFYYDFVKRHPDLFPAQKRDYTASRIAAEYLQSLKRNESKCDILVSNDSESEMIKANSISIDKHSECLRNLENTQTKSLVINNSDSKVTKVNCTLVEKNDSKLEPTAVIKMESIDIPF